MSYDVALIRQPRQTLYGLHKHSSDKAQSRDIPCLSKQFYAHTGTKPETVFPFYVVSRDYDADAGVFTLFIGDDGSNRGLEQEVLPAGIYAKLELRPRLGFLWGHSVGKAKRWFYSKWLPASGYEAVNLEYELHTRKSVGKHPAIDLLFGIKRK